MQFSVSQPAPVTTAVPALMDEAAQLGPLPGEICEQYVRCGKANCRCNNGHPHGPYHYRVWREGTRVFKQYVKPVELELTRERCRLYRAMFAKRPRGRRPSRSLAA